MNVWRDRLGKARRLGFWNTFVGLCKRSFFFILYLIFRFDRWHGRRPIETTNYKQVVISLARKLPPPTVTVDIGCGLGDLLRRVPGTIKYGIDIDARALRVARMLNFGRAIEYRTGSLDALSAVPERTVDLLIITNWLHGMSDEWVLRELRLMLQSTVVRHTIVDEVSYQPGRMERIFASLGTVVEMEHDWQDDKKIFLYRMNDTQSAV